jgi:hypothetical protein
MTSRIASTRGSGAAVGVREKRVYDLDGRLTRRERVSVLARR